jgi:transposase
MPVAVGIDMAKKDFESRFLSEVKGKPGAAFKDLNVSSGFRSLLDWAKEQAGGQEIIFCMESTGGYEFPLACFLAQHGQHVCVENPRPIKHFAAAMGMANKTDKTDARAIAAFALAMNPRPWVLSDETRRQLSQLNRHRENLMDELTRVRNRKEHWEVLPELQRKQLQAHQDLLKSQVKEVELEQARLVGECQQFKAEMAVLTKLHGIGDRTAIAILSEMPDVRSYDNAESWEAQAGMFPCKRESGTWKGQSRMSKSGNAHVRRAMYMGTTMSMRMNPTIMALAQRLRAKGKKPKQVRVACMRKLLLICYGLLKAFHEGKSLFYGFPPEKTLARA